MNSPGSHKPADNSTRALPVVLAVSGLDPTGSAGILADVRVIASTGCHPCGVVTCETVQTSGGLSHIQPTEPAILHEQLDALLGDIPVHAVKIGALASVETIRTLATILGDLSDIPIVLDPIFKPTHGPPFLDTDCQRALSSMLMPMTLISTPNVSELGIPAGMEVDPADDDLIGAMADAWLDLDLKSLLVTGLERDRQMVDRLYRKTPGREIVSTDFAHPKHPVKDVHGTGCVLSSAIASHLALGAELEDAIRKAIAFTSSVVANAREIGAGSMFWVD